MRRIKSILQTLHRFSQKAVWDSKLLKRKGAKTGFILSGTVGLGFFLNHLGGKRHRNQDQGNY